MVPGNTIVEAMEASGRLRETRGLHTLARNTTYEQRMGDITGVTTSYDVSSIFISTEHIHLPTTNLESPKRGEIQIDYKTSYLEI